jgi:UDP-N-acetylmuramate--alanine ligase
MSILDYNNFYLVGIKGVAMTSMAQILIEANKSVSGCDVDSEFVTKPLLDKLHLNIDIGFSHDLPKNIDCVIYTSAHQSQENKIVIKAVEQKLQIYTHAEALAELFNQKKGVAVCGVGGKSTVSAMVAWIMENSPGTKKTSFSIGVGNIPGLDKTGQWSKQSEYFIAEADEYVTDPGAKNNNLPITPRFSFLKPFITICTNLKFDHPDVYDDFNHTKKVFFEFFNQISPDGFLIINYKDLIHQPTASTNNVLTFGTSPKADFSYKIDKLSQKPGLNTGTLIHDDTNYQLKLQIPGVFNLSNAVAAIATAKLMGVDILDSINALKTFASTKRRFEYIGKKDDVIFYDDYAHHPHEVKASIQALKNWYPDHKRIIVFEPHTYSRTKKLLPEFVDAFNDAEEVYLLDIFASARESADESISSDILASRIQQSYPNNKVENLKTVGNLAEFLKESIMNKSTQTVVLTLGAGDIYKVHELL